MIERDNLVTVRKRSYTNSSLKSSKQVDNGFENILCHLSQCNFDYSDKEWKFLCPKSKRCKTESNRITTRSQMHLNAINPFDISDSSERNSTKPSFVCSSPKPNASIRRNNSINESLDSGIETESIFSFASKSGDEEEITSSLLLSSESNDSLDTDLPVYTDIVQINKYGYYQLPTINEYSIDGEIPQICSETLTKLLTGKHKNLKSGIRLFDCRFPYEYEGGHIVGSGNTYTCQKLLQSLFPNADNERNLEQDIDNMKISELKRDDTIYIFYCEFSSYRGPKLAECLRGLDRLGNSHSRRLYFPNIYLLHNGYSEFYNNYPELCSPQGYVSMQQTQYALRSSMMNNLSSLSMPESMIMEEETNCNNVNGSDSEKLYRKEQLMYQCEMKLAEKTLQHIIAKRTKDSDILKLFSSHLSIGASL